MSSAVSSTQNSEPTVGSSDVNVLKRKRNSVETEVAVKAPKSTPTSSPVSAKSVHRLSLAGTGKDDDFKDILVAKEKKFLSASEFAVVGASNDPAKWGHKVMSYLLEKKKDVVPINPNQQTVSGKTCLKNIKDLADPTHTSVSIVVPPKVTLEVLKQAKDLDIFCIWLQPGAEDDAVLEFLNESGLEERCIHASQHGQAGSDFVNTLAMRTNKLNQLQSAVAPVCEDIIANPSVVEDSTVASPVEDVPVSQGEKSSPASVKPSSADGNVLKRKRNFVQTEVAVKAPKSTSTSSPVSAKSVHRPSLAGTGKDDDFKDILMAKEKKFLSASKFAVVGASNDPAKWGHKVMSYLLEKKDVVPINPNQQTVSGKTCLKNIKDLSDPTHTSVSIVVPPKVTLEVLKQAKDLDIFCIWLQPGAEDDAVLEFLNESGLEERCIHATQHGQAGSDFVNTLAMKVNKLNQLQAQVGPICDDVIANPSVVEDSTVASPVEDAPVSQGEKSSPASVKPSAALTSAALRSNRVYMPCLIRDGSSMSRTSSLHEEIPGLA